jgi:hypothetical protein
MSHPVVTLDGTLRLSSPLMGGKWRPELFARQPYSLRSSISLGRGRPNCVISMDSNGSIRRQFGFLRQENIRRLGRPQSAPLRLPSADMALMTRASQAH